VDLEIVSRRLVGVGPAGWLLILPALRGFEMLFQGGKRMSRIVITREPGQSLFVGNNLIKVSSIHGQQVRLTVEAPREILVDRSEIRRRKEREAEVARRLSAGEGLTDIEMELDARENMDRRAMTGRLTERAHRRLHIARGTTQAD
jgi:carbon storage regulator CsrA